MCFQLCWHAVLMTASKPKVAAHYTIPGLGLIFT